MMSSMGSTRGNPRGGGGREKSSSKTSAQTTGKSTAADHQAHVGKKATADQMRLAQMYSDSTSEENTQEMIMKCIQKVQDVVPKSEDEVLVALHDSNYDTERAINLLLEKGDGDQGEWETISSKKSKQRSGVSTGFRNNSDLITNNKDNGPDKDMGGRDRRDNRGNKDRDGKDKDKDRDGFRDSGGRERDGERERGGFGGGGRGRGRNNRGQLPPRMARGRGRDNESNSRDREREKNERNRWDGGESGRGRGRRAYDHMNGPSRRGRGPRSFTNSKFGSNFEDDAFKPGDNVWTNPPAETENNTWDNSMVTEDWGAEDWSGDDAALNGGGRTDLATSGPGAAGGVGQPNWMTALTESKVFMASSTPPSTTPITLDSIESQSNAMPPASSLTGNSSLNAPASMSPGASLSAGTAGLSSSGMPPSSMPEMSRGISLAELFAKPSSASTVNSQPLGGTGLGTSNTMGGTGLGTSNSISGLGGSSGLGGIGVGSIGSSGIGSTGIGGAGTIGTSSGMGGLGNAIGSSAGMGSNSLGGTSSTIGDGLGQRPASSSVFSAYVDLKPPTQAPVSEPNKPTGQMQQLGGPPPEPPSATVPASQLTTNQQPPQQRVPSTAGTKPSKKKLPPPSTKIPASAVEMPGPVPARGLGVLDVQFGAMDINMEPSLPDFEVGTISSGSVPSTSLAVSVSLSSDAYSASEPSSSAAPHLSYTNKVSEPSYATPSMNSTLMANSTSTTSSALDQTARSVYAQSAQNRQMTPDPIPLPTQDLKGSTYMQQTQKPAPTPMDSKPDKQLSSTPGSHSSNHQTPLSALTSHPSSLASSLSSSGMSSSSGLHSQMGLSSHGAGHPSQSLGSSRQPPNSYHGPTSASIASTVHSGTSNVYGNSTPSVSHPSSAYSSVHSSLGVPSTHSSTGLSSSNLPPSGLPTGQSSISALSSGSQSGLSSGGQLSSTGQLTSGQLQSGSQLSSGSQLTNSQLASVTQLAAGAQLPSNSQLAGGSVQLPNSGHPPNSLSGSLNSAGLSGATPISNSHSTHTSVQTSPLTQGKLAGLDNRIQQGTNQHVLDHTNHQSSLGQSSLSSSGLSSSASHPTASLTTTTMASSYTSSAPVSASLGFGSTTGMNAAMTTTTTTSSTGVRANTLASNTKVPGIPPGMSFIHNQGQYMIGHPGNLPLVNAFPHQAPTAAFYNYEDFQMQLARMPGAAAAAATAAIGYPYDLQQFQQPATTLTAARDVSSLSTTPYSVTEASKFTRGDASSPVAASSLSAQQQTQQPAQHATGSHHSQQAAQQAQAALFNPTAAAAASIPPGYGYAAAGGLPYYPGPSMLPPGLQGYPTAAAVFPAVSTVQPTNRSQPATTLHSGFQQSAYGSHGAYGTGYDDLTQTQDFTKSGYSGVSQTQKAATGAAGVASRNSVAGTSAGSASVGAADISGSSYSSKTHTPSFPDKHSFPGHGTPPPFSFPLASGTQAGMNPAATAYPQHPFVPVMQHHNTPPTAILPQHLQGDSHTGTSARSQATSGPAKQTNKQPYGASTYWSAN